MLDALVYQVPGSPVYRKNPGVPGFKAAVEDNGGIKADMESSHRAGGSMNIGRRFKTSEKMQ